VHTIPTSAQDQVHQEGIRPVGGTYLSDCQKFTNGEWLCIGSASFSHMIFSY
jgi:hypothetical protein